MSHSDLVDMDLGAGGRAVLGLTGVTPREAAERFPVRPSRVAASNADLVPELS